MVLLDRPSVADPVAACRRGRPPRRRARCRRRTTPCRGRPRPSSSGSARPSCPAGRSAWRWTYSGSSTKYSPPEVPVRPLPSVLLPCGSSFVVTDVAGVVDERHGLPLAADLRLDEPVVPALLDEVPGPEVERRRRARGVEVEHACRTGSRSRRRGGRAPSAARPGSVLAVERDARSSSPGCGTSGTTCRRAAPSRSPVSPRLARLRHLACGTAPLKTSRPPQNSLFASAIVHAVVAGSPKSNALMSKRGRALVVEVDGHGPVHEQLLALSAGPRRSAALNWSIAACTPSIPSAGFWKMQLDQQVAAGAVVLLVGRHTCRRRCRPPAPRRTGRRRTRRRSSRGRRPSASAMSRGGRPGGRSSASRRRGSR